MPELPEVETTRRGIAGHLTDRRIEQVIVRDRRLRWPIPKGLEASLAGQTITRLARRAKYLLMLTTGGSAIMHLGMSGRLRIVRPDAVVQKHDHYDIRLDSGDILRFNDPRRFGCLLWSADDPANHPLLATLGPEPLSEAFTGRYLHALSRGRKIPIKQHLMNSRIVVGVGNIYASEALFMAGIHPKRAAGRIALARMETLTQSIKAVLEDSIRVGGTTLRDFYGGDGQPGYFRPELQVYGRNGKPCAKCQTPIRQIILGQRSTFYCLECQH
ncbi:MAG: bifunctional DNA-formamidopyrimidine glycosylase/DNA-(apurinic or apyrimidinic site) lyase [Gammaproteobacteria bacterium]|nr:bifunctional DNA-formamidopyrimidine glycosylase/DNA-(apurinic or apyrimidinic site) lyase [Gammaproteobacteria bacterium]